MDAFGYLSVLISIILGLALTQLLTGTGRLIRHRDRVRFYAPVAIWLGVLFIIIVQSWWTMFGLRNNEDWTFFEFLVVLLHPTLLYLIVDLAIPEPSDAGPIDLRANYFRQAPMFFGAAILLLVASLLRPIVLAGQVTDAADFAMQALFGTLAFIAIFWKSPRYHLALAPAMALLIAIYIGALFLSLR